MAPETGTPADDADNIEGPAAVVEGAGGSRVVDDVEVDDGEEVEKLDGAVSMSVVVVAGAAVTADDVVVGSP